MWTFILVSVLLTAGLRAAQDFDNILRAAQDFDNILRGVLHRPCPDQHVVSQIESSYSANDQDRQWKIECKSVGTTSDCSWSSPQDVFENELNYNCPANHVVAGVHSDYNNAEGGRSWSFLCCSAQNLITSEYRKTPMVNYWSEDFNLQLPAGHFLTGIQTHLKNNDGDHRWSFNYAKGQALFTQTINSQILTANQQIANHLMQGDVFVSNTKNAQICANCRWERFQADQTVQVPYVVSDSFSNPEKIEIENAISAFHMSTCIRFVTRTDQIDYISIVKQNGCWSWLGRIGMAQELSLGTGCLQKGIIQHELIHALGFWHEQNRNDRDAFVKIHFENVQAGLEENFDIKDTNNLNVPYDYASVMHYGPKDFSKNSGDTIVPLDPLAQVGQRDGMTENDILKINKLHDCKNYLHQYGEWDNILENKLSRSCPSSQAVSGITSLYNNDKQDRLWAFSCKAFKVERTCQWSDPVNEQWAPMNFNCGDDQVIAGVYSNRSNTVHDRIWRFQCCSSPGFTTSNCQTVNNINYYQEYFSWSVASDHFLTGVTSSFDENSRDRRWSLTYCQGKSDKLP